MGRRQKITPEGKHGIEEGDQRDASATEGRSCHLAAAAACREEKGDDFDIPFVPPPDQRIRNP